ncbi:MAG: hybrid sensor histidine kinase/response regulator, partial [Cyanobacteria bacterium J06641_5]
IVDDSPDNLLLVQSILEGEGYDIVEASDGPGALEAVAATPPDLILLDVMMPGMDGFEVTTKLRADRELPFIPILLITAYDQPSVVRGLDSGADDFIRKPVEVDELLARVRSLLRLKHTVDERDEIARQRADFVSRLAHDLRTPLVAADRMLGLFLQGILGEVPPKMQEALATMSRSNRNLLAMVNTMLEVYRFEAGRKVFSFRPLDLNQLLTEIFQELAPLAEEKSLTLKPSWEAGTEAMVGGDRLELHRLFTNLLGNAIKFTESGWIEVTVGTQGNEWIVDVTDSGPGITPEEQKHLFERFRPGKHGQTGSGLGLHLSQRIAQSHGGCIAVASTPGQGSTFSVHLPHEQSQAMATEPATAGGQA